MRLVEVLKRVDWKLLILQKEALVSLQANTVDYIDEDTLNGVIELLDHLQDAAVEDGLLTEKEVEDVYDEYLLDQE
jgi:hypothetical protein